MVDVSGDFEIHLTVGANQAGKLAAFAERHGVKFIHVLLDRGLNASQPMLTLTGSGTLSEQHSAVQRWKALVEAEDMYVFRTKIEAAPWCAGVPEQDGDAVGEPAGRYFEHHVKVLLPTPSVADLSTLADVVSPYGARLSRNARRQRTDGVQERFVNQRCDRVGRSTARQRLDELVTAVGAAGYEVASAEQEYVVFDSARGHDHGWMEVNKPSAYTIKREVAMRSAPAGSPNYPPTYQPVTGSRHVHQKAAFDPALRQYSNAYRAGEPVFTSPAAGQRWAEARSAAMTHLLGVIAAAPWAEHLVLRGSVTMTAWVGTEARAPGDLDFVVVPHTVASTSAQAAALLAGIRTAVATTPGAGLAPHRTVESAIWTYERADGRRLVIPFQVDDVTGSVQVDIVFGEEMPFPPTTVTLPGVDVPIRAAGPALSLAWKLLWLATDMFPQGKDLYDAVLLAEHTTVELELVRELIRPELGAEADTFDAETLLSWDVDWTNFTDEYPRVDGTLEQWLRRLANALERSWR